MEENKQYVYLKNEYQKPQTEYLRENNKMLKYICTLLTINTIGILIILLPVLMWLANMMN